MLAFPVLTFITSFSTMCYAMITASIMSDFSGEEVISQCLTMGPYLLGLGLGSARGDKIDSSGYLSTLRRYEWLSVTTLPLIPMLHMIFIFFYLNLSTPGTTVEGPQAMAMLLGTGIVFSLASGLMGGIQLPLIIKLARNRRANLILAISYMGPLVAGPLIVYMNHQTFLISTQVSLVALTQLVGLIILISMESSRVKPLLFLVFPMLVIYLNLKYYPSVEYISVKSSYLGTRINELSFSGIKNVITTVKQYGELERVKTSYQIIDLLIEPPNPYNRRPGNSSVYLNRKPQFDQQTVDVYHESMVQAAFNLANLPDKNILILGAGDGILLKELKPFKDIKKITMVELDPGMIEWSRSNMIVSQLNENSLALSDPRVELIIDDAISFLRRNKEKRFDVIFIDFPFPNGHELAKLYSYEFYKLVQRSLAKEGVLIIDLPVQFDEAGKATYETAVILKTMYQSGLKNPYVICPFSSFVVFRGDGKKSRFDYSRFPANINVSTRLNLVEIGHSKYFSEKNLESYPVNSMFWPRGL